MTVGEVTARRLVRGGVVRYAPTLVLFPGAYAGLEEKPCYSEVIESIRQANLAAGSAR